MTSPGGYQAPANPAPVSGPGALSARTDGGPGQGVRALPDAKYGENRDFVAQQQGAPLSKSPNPPTMAQAAAAAPAAPAAEPPELVPMGAQSLRPNEPVTAGAALGPGPGPAPAYNPAPKSISSTLTQYAANDKTGQIADLAWNLNQMGL